jgi:adenylate cyclase
VRQKVTALALIVAISLVLGWVIVLTASAVRGDWNNRLNDAFFRLRFAIKGPERMLPGIGHVDLTDSIVHELGMKGGDRRDFARLVKVLSQAGAASITFDIVFPDPGSPDGDSQFAAATGEAGTVYLPAIMRTPEYSSVAGMPTGNNPAAQWLWHPKVERSGDAVSAVAATTSYEALNEGARGMGSINSEPDPDGLFRRMPLLIPFQDGFMPAIALRVACDALKVDPRNIEVSFGKRIRLPSAHMPDGKVRTIDIPIDRAGRMIVDYAGPWAASFPHYSLSALLKAEDDSDVADSVAAELEGSHLIVSDLTTSASDYGAVPFERVYPRSGIHANIINSILTGRFLRAQTWLESLLLSLCFGALLWLVLWRLRPLAGSLLALACWAALLCLQFALFALVGVMPALAAPTVGFVLALVAANAYSFFQSEQEKLRQRTRMERYFAPRLMSKILQAPDKLMSAEKKVITVLFSDIAGFTSWCTTQPPDIIHRTLNEYFELMTEIVFRNEGTVDKFIGDGLMAFFGDPLPQPDHALRAVRTGMEMQQTVRALRDRWGKEGRMPIHIRIGINAGEVVVGDMGSQRIMAYTAIGANINLGSRLESKAPIDGVLVSAPVYDAVKDSVGTRFAGKITAKGITEDFETYEVIVP